MAYEEDSERAFWRLQDQTMKTTRAGAAPRMFIP